MSLLDRIRNLFGPGSPRPRLSDHLARPVRLRASYDAAQTTTDNYKHWAAADALSADAANSPAVRKRLRERSRYEVANNCYARGLVLSVANYEIGMGPKLEVHTDDADFNGTVEAAWSGWASAVGLAEKLRTMAMSRVVDGEAFALLASNPAAGEDEVQLDFRLIEADQVASPQLFLARNRIDGIAFDESGNPTSYDVLDDHPGGPWPVLSLTARSIDARYVLHLFRADRPGQHRGVPELTPGLGLFAQMRRYTEAVIAAAETAADWSVLLSTDGSPNDGPDEVAPLDEIELAKRMMTTLPMGWKASQMHPEQPPPTFREFRQEVLGKMGRAVCVPRSLSSADSSDANFSSAKLDHLGYYRAVAVNQSQIEARVLDRLFAQWFLEAVKVYRWTVPDSPPPRHEWRWVPPREADEETMENARLTRIKSGATSLSREFAAQGLDAETEIARAAADYGVSEEEYRRRLLDAHYPVKADAGEIVPPPSRLQRSNGHPAPTRREHALPQ